MWEPEVDGPDALSMIHDGPWDLPPDEDMPPDAGIEVSSDLVRVQKNDFDDSCGQHGLMDEDQGCAQDVPPEEDFPLDDSALLACGMAPDYFAGDEDDFWGTETQRKPVQSIHAAIDAEDPYICWRAFREDAIDKSRCLARVEGGGLGAQCLKRRVPGSALCAQHLPMKSLKYGRVTEDVSRKGVEALERLRKNASKERRQSLYYTRYHFYQAAKDLLRSDEGKRSVHDLGDVEISACLMRTHTH